MYTKKIAVVTGANKGIGYAIVQLLSKEPNLHVVLAARNQELGQAAIKKLNDEGIANVEFLYLDIDDKKSVESAAATLKRKFGGIDILINNAAIALYTGKTDYETAVTTFNTNYYATIDVLDKFLPLVRQGGRVVNVSSMGGYMIKISDELKNQFFSPSLTIEKLNSLVQQFLEDVKNNRINEGGWGPSSYSISKLALTIYTKLLANSETYKDKKILINAVCPGYVNTDLTKGKGVLTVEQGAETPVFAALLPADSQLHGLFLSEKIVKNYDDYPKIDYNNPPWEAPN